MHRSRSRFRNTLSALGCHRNFPDSVSGAVTMPSLFLLLLTASSLGSVAGIAEVTSGHQDEVCGRGKDCGSFREEWVVHVSGGRATARHVARQMRLELVEELPGFPDYYVLQAKPREPRSYIYRNRRHTSILTSPHVNWAQRQVPLIRQKRSSLPNMKWNDPLYSDMWYINRASEGQGYDMNVQEAWRLGYSGKGVVVTIMDDGIDYTHPDLRKNYDPKASLDLTDLDDDPMPDLKASENNRHGTRCAGQVAASGNNSVCVVGVAHNSRIGGIRMLDGYITDRLEAKSLGFQNNHIDIYSGSWGPEDTGKMHEGPGLLAASAIQKGVTTGRHGLGNIYVWASGNGGEAGDSCACDGYASSPYTLSVSGVGENNTRPWYLEKCASTLTTTYSSGSSSERMIATVDAHHQCTNKHTGTSAAAPLAASIIGLLLEANPRLTWRDVQYITLLTANPTPFADGNFTTNAVGRAYSQFYGYGLMDAGKMVRLGELWRTVPQQQRCTSMVRTFKIPLKKRFNHTIELNFTGCASTHTPGNPIGLANASEANPLLYLEHVQIYSEIIYQRRGLLQVTLISPSGTESVLLPPRILDDHTGETNILKWPLTSVQFWGETAIGTWKVRLDNLVGMDDLLRVDPQRLQDMLRRLPRHRRQLQGLHQAAKKAHTLWGSWRSVWLVFYGTTEFPIRLKPPPPERAPPADWFSDFSGYVVHDSQFYDVYTCHSQCAPGGCIGPLANQCLGGCLHFVTQSRHCVETCPLGTTPYRISNSQRRALNRQKKGSKLSRWQASQRLRQRRGELPDPEDDLHVDDDGDGEFVCQPCSSFCSSCVRPHAEFECTACADDRYLVPIMMPNRSRVFGQSYSPGPVDSLPEGVSVGVCRTDCPVGYYVNKVAGICQPCADNCAECTSPADGDCQDCDPGFRLMNGRCHDGQAVNGLCQIGQFIQKSRCVSCPAWCDLAGCMPYGGCYTCRYPNIYFYNQTCVVTCPAGWYPGYPIMSPYSVTQLSDRLRSSRSFDASATVPPPLRLCEPCAPGCSQCVDFSTCLRCVGALQMVNGTCVHPEQAASKHTCTAPCSTCLFASDDCASCGGLTEHLLALDYLLLSVGARTSDSLLLLLNRRRPLHVTTKTSKGVVNRAMAGQIRPVTTTTVTVAIETTGQGGGLVLPTYTCSASCPLTTFASLTTFVSRGGGETKLCRPCPPSCLACTDSNHCTACRSGFHLSPETAACLPNEPCRTTSYYDHKRKTCVPCHTQCNTCLGPTASDCTSCPQRGGLPRCLDLAGVKLADPMAPGLPTSAPADYPVDPGDSVAVRGHCLACCDYRQALVAPMLRVGCGFCLAGKVACMSPAVLQMEEDNGWLIFPTDDGAGHHPHQHQHQKPATEGQQQDLTGTRPAGFRLLAILLISLLLLVCLLVSAGIAYRCRCVRQPLVVGKPGGVTTAFSQRAAGAHAHHLQAMENRKADAVQDSSFTVTIDLANTPLIAANGTVPGHSERLLHANGSVLQRWPSNSVATPGRQHVLYTQLTQSTIDQLDDDEDDDDDRSSGEGHDAVCTTHAGRRDEYCDRRDGFHGNRGSPSASVPGSGHGLDNGSLQVPSPAALVLKSNPQIDCRSSRSSGLQLADTELTSSKPHLFRPNHRKPLS